MARRKGTGPSRVPADLPAYLSNPVIGLNPEYEPVNRKYQALLSFKRYVRELSDWLSSREYTKHLDINEIMEDFGTTLDRFLAVAESLSPRQSALDP